MSEYRVQITLERCAGRAVMRFYESGPDGVRGVGFPQEGAVAVDIDYDIGAGPTGRLITLDEVIAVLQWYLDSLRSGQTCGTMETAADRPLAKVIALPLHSTAQPAPSEQAPARPAPPPVQRPTSFLWRMLYEERNDRGQ